MDQDPEARAAALEMRLAYQERALDDLGAVVTAQWQAIESLKRQVAGLIDRLAEAEAEAALPGLPEKPPPHY